jgi:PII-like signaling protein
MKSQPAKLLRLYVNEQDRYEGKPLYEAIVARCQELKVAGVTVFRGLEGFGESAELHHAHLFRSDQPLVITIVERPEKAQETLPILQSMMNSGLIAVTDVELTVISGSRVTSPALSSAASNPSPPPTY